jgi:hypothetical protein
MVFNVTLLAENHRSAQNHWQTLWHICCIEYTSPERDSNSQSGWTKQHQWHIKLEKKKKKWIKRNKPWCLERANKILIHSLYTHILFIDGMDILLHKTLVDFPNSLKQNKITSPR